MEEGRRTIPVIDHVRKASERVLNTVIGIMLASMVVIVFGNVIFRYFLNTSIAWSEEVSRFMLIWLSFLGAVIAFMKNEHLGLDILVKFLPPIASKALVVFADVLVIFALAVMTKGGIDMTVDSFASGWVSSAVPIPYGYVYAVAPISSGLMLLESILKTFVDSATLASALKRRA
mgnify:CR=1 FL=1